MKLITKVDAAAILPSLTGSCFGLVLSQEGQAYYRDSCAEPPEDVSFAYFDDQGLACLVPCTLSASGALDRYGFPIELWTREGLSDAALLQLARDIAGELGTIAKANGRDRIGLRAPRNEKLAAHLASKLVGQGLIGQASYIAWADISGSDEEVMAGLSQGHRRHVRAGMKSHELMFIDCNNPDDAALASYQALHAEVAGRVTRPQASWDRMFEMVRAGMGGLALSYLDGALLGGTLMLDAGDTSYYASGAYVRSEFDKPISHYPLYASALAARSRGRTRVHIGEINQGVFDSSEKERSIAKFKLGFVSSLATSQIWTIPVTQPGQA